MENIVGIVLIFVIVSFIMFFMNKIQDFFVLNFTKKGKEKKKRNYALKQEMLEIHEDLVKKGIVHEK